MRVWRRLRNDPVGMVCLCFLLAVAALALCAPLAAPWDPTAIDIKNKFAAWSLAHPLGTDQLGRDVLSRLIWGGRATLGFSLLTMGITLVIGSGLGIVAGFCRGKVDETIMRFCDVMMSFPSEVLILAIVGMLGPGLGNVVIASVIAKWPWYARMIRSVVMQYTDVNYVRFARVAGCGMWHILRRHLLPGALGEIIVLATLDTGAVILSVSALSFLGLGVQPPTPEWGTMLASARDYIERAWWVVSLPGLTILLSVLAINLMGDGLRDALDPKLKNAA